MGEFMVEVYNITVGSAVGVFVALCLLVPVALIQWKRGYQQGKDDGRDEAVDACNRALESGRIYKGSAGVVTGYACTPGEWAAEQAKKRTAGDIVREKDSGAGSRDGRDSSGLANRGRTRPT